MFNRLAVFLLFACAAHLPAGAQGYKPSGGAPGQTTYIFGIHPYTTPQDLFSDYAPVMRYLEKNIPGTRFEVEASRNYGDYEAKLVARKFHFSLPNPAQTVIGMENGYHVIAKMVPDEDFRGLIIAREDRAPATPQELAGKTLCFPSASAVAGTMLPLLYLHDNGVDTKGLQVRYVGSQYSSIVNVLTGDFAACGSTARFWRSWSRENPEKAKQIRVLWRTPTLPHNAIIARDDVPEAVAARVAAVLSAMDKDKGLDQRQFDIDQQHFEPATNATYRPVMVFLRRYQDTVGLPDNIRLPRSR
ncbi:MAG: phosphate/phosphite/phosphonate ABC transporter substrate-binding protein [Rhodocyclaceae bacterium]|nr:phosphate/phosphite/phosphonate ABC transporter substrate-binding protein [Rhodocyclaceae bacterium]